MAEPTYYLRLRGRVSGPFTVGQLQTMHLRGQFGRFHEVSSDAQRWQPASALTHLFPAPPPPTRPPSDPDPVLLTPAAPGPAAPPGPEETLAAPAPVAAEAPDPREEAWYYEGGDGQPAGPVSLDGLAALLRDGAVRKTTLVS